MRLDEFYNPENDKYQQISADDTRKTRLTLEQVNKLRKYRDIKQAEKKSHDEFVRTMYSQPAADAGGL